MSIVLMQLFCYSCRNSNVKKDETFTQSPYKMNIDSNLENEILLFISFSYQHGIDTNIAFTVEFSREGNFKNPGSNDSTIMISTLNCNANEKGYQGVLLIKKSKVALFDKSDFGNKFYEYSRLRKIPIDSLKCLDDSIIYAVVYVIRNGELSMLW